jgi:hypothetical protein
MLLILKHWKNTIILGGVLVVVLIILSSSRPKLIKQDAQKTEGTELISTEPKVMTKINWAPEKVDIPTSIKEINNQLKVDDQTTIQFESWLGLTGFSKVYGDKKYIDYENVDGDTIVVDLEKRTVNYNLNRRNTDLGLIIVGDEDVKLARSSFDKLLAKIGSTNQVEIRNVNVYYQKSNAGENDFVTQDQANLIVFESNYGLNGKDLLSSEGRSNIKAKYSVNGVLAELVIENPIINLIDGEEKKLVSQEELEKLTAESYKILALNGKPFRATNVSIQNLGEINIKSIETEYMFFPGKNMYIPYLILRGNTWLSTEPAVIMLGIPAEK